MVGAGPRDGDAGSPLLAIDDLQIRFGGVFALRGVSFSVAPGSITSLIGPNGAGKTTLFNTVSGFNKPAAGRVAFQGRDVTGLAPDRLAREGLVRTFQIARGLPSLTVLENLMLYGVDQPGESLSALFLRRATTKKSEGELREQAWQILGRLELQHVADHLAGELSGGQRKLIELGRIMMRRPTLVLLDEPAAGVNPGLAMRLAEHITAYRREGVTFLVVEHNMGLVEQISDEVVVMAEGRRLAQGSFEAIRNDHVVQSAYMGDRA